MLTINKTLYPLYPFDSHYLDINENSLHYLDEGEGEVVLMLHGNPTWSFYYRNLVLKLRDQFRCVAPDHMGCGLSSKPQIYPYRLSMHIANVEQLVSKLNIKRFHLVIHDWGGAIGMGLAKNMPDRVGKIIILNSAAFLSQQLPLRIKLCRTPILGAVLIRAFNVFARYALTMATAKKGGLKGKVREGFLFPYHNWSSRIAQLRFVQDIPMRPKDNSYPLMQEIENSLQEFQKNQVLICWGEQDFCFNDHFLKTWMKYYPTAEVYKFSDGGHYILEDGGEKILILIRDFLLRN